MACRGRGQQKLIVFSAMESQIEAILSRIRMGMDRQDRTDPDKTVIRPRAADPDKTVIAPRQKIQSAKAPASAPPDAPAASTIKAPLASPRPISKPSAFPVVALGVAAFLFLSVTAGLVAVYVMTGGKSEVSDESLNADLVAVEPSQVEENQPGQPQIPEILPPKIIGLSGDPITIHRGVSISRQLVKLGSQAAAAAAPIGVHGDLFRLSDLLTSADDTLGAGLPGSPIFAGEDTPDRLTVFLVPISKWSDGTADSDKN